MRVRALVGVVFAGLCGIVAAAAEPPVPLAGGVFLVGDVGGNVAVLDSPEGVLVVDTGIREHGEALVERVQAISTEPVRFVVLTHFHFDHVENNARFPGAAQIAHDTVPERIRAAAAETLRDTPSRIESARRAGDADGVTWMTARLDWARQAQKDPRAIPGLTFPSELTLSLGDETVRLWHLGNGHTDGDVLVYFERANVLHTGDLVFRQIIPYMDAAWGTSLAGWIAILDDVAKRLPPDVKVIPGHGPVTDQDGVREQRAYLAELLEAACQAKKQGKTRDDFVKSVALPRYAAYDGHAQRFGQNAGVAWDEAR